MRQRKVLFFLVLFFSIIQCSAQSEKQDRIDEAYHKCLLKDTTYATICNCAFIAFDKWNKEMDKAYDKLLRTLKKEKDKTALKQSQKAWIAYKEAEFTTYDYIFNIPGNKWCSIRQDGRIDIVRARALQLRDYEQYLETKNGKSIYILHEK